MNDTENKAEGNKFEEQIEEVKEWQQNANNPGYYVGTGRATLPMKNILRSPVILILIGVICLVISICNIVGEFSFSSVMGNLTMLIIGAGLLIGGILRALGSRKNKD